jgi:hypothetical protein
MGAISRAKERFYGKVLKLVANPIRGRVGLLD